MKRAALILITIVCFLVFVNAQDDNSISKASETANQKSLTSAHPEILSVLFATNTSQGSDILDHRASLTKFIDKEKRKMQRYNNDEYFLEHLFYRVHNKFLKSYKQYMSFEDIFDNGYYDCVTGTALYAYILEELGYDAQIYESNYHVLLVLNLDNKKILMEATDFYTGFVNDEDEVAKRIAHYKQVNKEEGDYYQFKTFSDNFINLRQLSGLLYFNLAIKQYNDQDFENALAYLEKAECLYPCSRMKELRNLINNQLTADQILSSTRSIN